MSKRLVVCFDGTWNAADTGGAETNVARIARAIHANVDTGGVLQCVLYLRGVGTSGLAATDILQGATGEGIDENIRSGYMFLAQNYLPGDEIFVFGFSRGAFTARSLAGFIGACGLLKRQRLGDLGLAWKYYRGPAPRSPADFVAKTQSDTQLDVRIRFLGVWDTVGALGVPAGILSAINAADYGFHDTGPSAVVQHGCHALSIDEHRDEFVPTLWTGQAPPGVTIEQVWFAGVHADVGGGYVTRALADIPLVWMAQKAEADGLALDWTCLPARDKLDPLGPQHDSTTTLFLKDRLTPTFREVCGEPFQVSLYERLYAPAGGDGSRLPVINQSIHQSVLDRYGRNAPLCTADPQGTCTTTPYTPRNLAPLFSSPGVVKPEITITPYG